MISEVVSTVQPRLSEHLGCSDGEKFSDNRNNIKSMRDEFYLIF